MQMALSASPGYSRRYAKQQHAIKSFSCLPRFITALWVSSQRWHILQWSTTQGMSLQVRTLFWLFLLGFGFRLRGFRLWLRLGLQLGLLGFLFKYGVLLRLEPVKLRRRGWSGLPWGFRGSGRRWNGGGALGDQQFGDKALLEQSGHAEGRLSDGLYDLAVPVHSQLVPVCSVVNQNIPDVHEEAEICEIDGTFDYKGFLQGDPASKGLNTGAT